MIVVVFMIICHDHCRSTSQRRLRKSLRLHPYLCETSYLDEVSKLESF